MAYPNNNFCIASAAPEESDSYPLLWCQPIAEELERQVTPTFSDGWTTADRPDPMAVPSTSLLTATSYGSSTSGSTPILPYKSHWSGVDHTIEPSHTGAWSLDDFFVGGREWEAAAFPPARDHAPADSWGSQHRELPTDWSYTDTPSNHHQPGPGAARSGTMDTRRFTLYEPYGSRPSKRGNAEARPATKPTGGLSEATADAKQQKPATEEEETPAPRTRRRRGEGAARPYRERSRNDVLKLRTWAIVLRKSRELPSHQYAIVAATEIISVFRQPVYDKDRLFRGHGHRTGVDSKEANEEYERRNGTRQSYQALSRLYPLEGGRSTWTTPQLLSRVLDDIDIIADILGNI